MQQLIERLRQTVTSDPKRLAFQSTQGNISYQELIEKLGEISAEIGVLGVSRVGIYADNSVDWALIDIAATASNIAVIPIPLFFSKDQIEHLCKASDLDTVFCDRPFPLPWRMQTISRATKGHYSTSRTGNFSAENSSLEESTFNKVTFTSGSTGSPKGACLRIDTLLKITSSLARALEPSKLGSHLCLLPFSTLLENVAGIYLTLWMGRTICVEAPERLGLLSNHQFDAETFIQQVKSTGAESVILLPQMLRDVLESNSVDSLCSLKFIAVGGGKVAPELLNRAHQYGLSIFEGYGLTECGSCVALNTPRANRIGSVGKPLPHAQVRIAEDGEIWVTGAAMQGYLSNESQLTEIATGDAGYIDEDGFLHVTGRIKNTLISSFGRNISPEWVEAELLSQPSIEQAIVFGDAQPCLSAVLVVPSTIDDPHLYSMVEKVNKGLPDYARVMSWVRTDQRFSVEDGTLTETGKPRRAIIAKQFETASRSSWGVA